jgi:hypothetical protein
MRRYEVAFGPEGQPPIETQTVEAKDINEAIWIVLDPFRGDHRATDAKSWEVKARQVLDA